MVLLAACGSGGDRPAPGAGRSAAEALVAAVDRAQTVAAPWRCARPGDAAAAGAAPIVAGERTWTRTGEALASDGATLTIVAVADARGAADARVRDRARAAGAEVVIAVGGMGTTEAELGAALGAIVDPAWLTVAIPGTTEAYPAHRAAVAALAGGGAPIVDGADVRLLDAGAAVIATLPGLPYVERLAAAAEGCGHDAADVERTLAMVRARAGDRPTVLAGPRAPQGGRSDLTPGGVHAGDPELAEAAAAVSIVLHAPLDGAPTPRGQGDGDDHDAVAAGSLDPAPRHAPGGARLAPGVTVVGFDRRGRAWRAVPLDPMVR